METELLDAGSERPSLTVVGTANESVRRRKSERKIMIARSFTAAILILGAAGPISANTPQEIDLASLKCSEFLSSDQDTSTKIMFWLGGYYTYDDDSPVMNTKKISEKAQQIKQYCADNASVTLISASEIFMDKKYQK
jgi:HdeA/HdeB family